MAFIGNLLWFIFGGGFIACLAWCLLGCFFAITIVGLPFAKAAFNIAGFAAFPFGKELVDKRQVGEKRIPGTGFVNFLWIILAGFWLAVGHILAGIGCLLSFFLIVPIFFGFAHFKLAGVSFAPLGKTVVPESPPWIIFLFAILGIVLGFILTLIILTSGTSVAPFVYTLF